MNKCLEECLENWQGSMWKVIDLFVLSDKGVHDPLIFLNLVSPCFEWTQWRTEGAEGRFAPGAL